MEDFVARLEEGVPAVLAAHGSVAGAVFGDVRRGKALGVVLERVKIVRSPIGEPSPGTGTAGPELRRCWAGEAEVNVAGYW